MFMGDHTSPDSEGYVRVIRDVVTRFHPTLRPTLISTGSSEQTARALNSDTLLGILTSSSPTWLVIGIGLADALREPLLGPLSEQFNREKAADADADVTFGRELPSNGSTPKAGKVDTYHLARLDSFEADLASAVSSFGAAGINPVILTTVLVGPDALHPLNGILSSYNKALRRIAGEFGLPLVDIERAFGDLFARAVQYKQKIAPAGYRGEITPQGEALIARTFLQTFDLLPHPGYRPLR